MPPLPPKSSFLSSVPKLATTSPRWCCVWCCPPVTAVRLPPCDACCCGPLAHSPTLHTQSLITRSFGHLRISSILRGFWILKYFIGIPPQPNESAARTRATRADKHREAPEMESETAADRERVWQQADADGASNQQQSATDTAVAHSSGMLYSATDEAGEQQQQQCKEEAGHVEGAGVCVSSWAKPTKRYTVRTGIELVPTCWYIRGYALHRYWGTKHSGSGLRPKRSLFYCHTADDRKRRQHQERPKSANGSRQKPRIMGYILWYTRRHKTAQQQLPCVWGWALAQQYRGYLLNLPVEMLPAGSRQCSDVSAIRTSEKHAKLYYGNPPKRFLRGDK